MPSEEAPWKRLVVLMAAQVGRVLDWMRTFPDERGADSEVEKWWSIQMAAQRFGSYSEMAESIPV